MSNEFHGTGHVREEPIVKVIAAGANRYTFATLQVFFPDGSPPADGSDERAGGFSLEVNVWGEHRAAMVKLLARKGTRLRVSGRLAEARWSVPATAKERREVYVVADKLFLRIPDNAHADRRPGQEDSGSPA